MVTQSRPADARLLSRPFPAEERGESPSESRPMVVILAGLVCACLTILVLGVVAVARTGALAQLSDLPERLLPGQALPENVACYTFSDEHLPRCSVDVAGYEIYFEVEAGTGTITRTLIPTQKYTIGDMILGWGTPTGITRRDTMIYIHWRTRSALLYTSAFRPDNRLEFILYDLEPLPASPWRGFRLYKRVGA